MKKLIRLAVLVAVVAAIVWLVRDRLVPAPEPVGEPPPFRPPPPPPSPSPPAPPPAAADDLTEISGIGTTRVEQLAALGITTFAGLAAADAATLAAELAGVGESQIEEWISTARERA